MIKIRRAIEIVAIALTTQLFMLSNVSATVIDFNSAAESILTSDDYIEDGYQMQSTSGHYDITDSFSGPPTSPITSPDATNFLTIDNDIGGPTSVSVRFDNFGGLFDLISLDVLYTDGFGGAQVTSSGGGLFSLTDLGTVNFAGAAWSDLLWFDLIIDNPSTWLMVDNINLNATDVPLPTTLALFSLGLLGLRFTRRNSQLRY